MKPFTYERATEPGAAVTAVARAGAKFISGGTNLLDLMKLEIEQPTHLVDISRLPLRDIEELPDGGLWIGAQAGQIQQHGEGRLLDLDGEDDLLDLPFQRFGRALLTLGGEAELLLEVARELQQLRFVGSGTQSAGVGLGARRVAAKFGGCLIRLCWRTARQGAEDRVNDA